MEVPRESGEGGGAGGDVGNAQVREVGLCEEKEIALVACHLG